MCLDNEELLEISFHIIEIRNDFLLILLHLLFNETHYGFIVLLYLIFHTKKHCGQGRRVYLLTIIDKSLTYRTTNIAIIFKPTK